MSDIKARQWQEPRSRNGIIPQYRMGDSNGGTRWENKLLHEGETWQTESCCQAYWRRKILTDLVFLEMGEEVFQKGWQQSQDDAEERVERTRRSCNYVELVEENDVSAKNVDICYKETDEKEGKKTRVVDGIENEIQEVVHEELGAGARCRTPEVQVELVKKEKLGKNRTHGIRLVQPKTRRLSSLRLRHNGTAKDVTSRRMRAPKRDDSFSFWWNGPASMTTRVSPCAPLGCWETKALSSASLQGVLGSPLTRSLLSILISMSSPRVDLRLTCIRNCPEVIPEYYTTQEWLQPSSHHPEPQPSGEIHTQHVNFLKLATATLATLRVSLTRTSYYFSAAVGPPPCPLSTIPQLLLASPNVTLSFTHRIMSEVRSPSPRSLAPLPRRHSPSPWQQRTSTPTPRHGERPLPVTQGKSKSVSFCPVETILPFEDRDPARRHDAPPCARPWHLWSRPFDLRHLFEGTAGRWRNGGWCTYKGMLVLLLVTLLVTELGAQDAAIIRTRQGPVEAVVRVSNKRNIYAFLGIPYAQPPINELRFKRPQRHEGWRETLKASEEGVACPQPFLRGIRMDEDCLTLNIWIPEMPLGYRKTPVVVVLEGELFLTSNPSRFPGEDLAAADVIVVTINYRTNAFGFLSTSNAEMAGNMGLWDQHLALSWVMENIELFGGDVTRVTLLGHSAGAASSSYHLVSSRSQGLFSRLILMSGSFMAPWALSRYPRRAATRLAELLECGYTSYSRYLLECLQKQDVNRVVKAVEKLIELGDPDLLFGPVVDDFLRPEEQFVPRIPEAALARAGSRHIPVVVGLSEDEGSVMLFLKREINYMPYDDLARYGREVLVPMVTRLAHLGPAHALVVDHLVSFEYLDLAVRKDRDSLVRQVINMFSDGLFKASTLRLSRALSENGMPPFLFVNKFSSIDIYESPSNISGALHGAELVYLFGPSAYRRLFYRTFNYNEERLSDSLKQLVYSFASTGEPTLRSYAPRWNQYTQQEPTYAILESGQVYTDYDRHQMAFWNELLPTLANMAHVIPPLPTRTVSPEGTPITDSQIVTGQQVVPYKSAVWVLVAILLVLLILIVVYVVCARRRQKHSTSTLHEQ